MVGGGDVGVGRQLRQWNMLTLLIAAVILSCSLVGGSGLEQGGAVTDGFTAGSPLPSCPHYPYPTEEAVEVIYNTGNAAVLRWMRKQQVLADKLEECRNAY
tara:strand:- start:389 stop:691 length:303 start_codon:yes stop_codon:yes gene_type:complete